MTKKTSKATLTSSSSDSKGESSKIRVGIVGLPNVGKSSLFNALVRRSLAASENFPFCTIEPNVAQIALPDPYLERLSQFAKSIKTIPATMEFVDVAGLVANASRGEGLGNRFLASIRECDAIIHLLRCYEDNRVVHVTGKIDPVTDAKIVNTELQLADMAHIERRLEKANCHGEEREALQHLLPKLKEGIPARSYDLSQAAQAAIKSMGLLTLKPVLYAFNVSRQAFLFEREETMAMANSALEKIPYSNPSHDMIALCSAKMEARMSLLEPADEMEHLHKFGVDPSKDKEMEESMCWTTLPLLIEKLLHLGLLYTGPGVHTSRSLTTRAYLFRQDHPPTALQFAGKLHGDIQKGFIKADVISAPTLLEYTNYHEAREAGQVRTEGKEHILRNYDVVLVKFK